MRHLFLLSALALLASPVAAQDQPASPEPDAPAARKCIAPQAIVSPFNNTPEAMEQSRVAATIVAGDSVCRSSPLMPELSEIQDGAEEAVVPGEDAADEAEPA